jgi:hypothetical protein
MWPFLIWFYTVRLKSTKGPVTFPQSAE